MVRRLLAAAFMAMPSVAFAVPVASIDLATYVKIGQ